MSSTFYAEYKKQAWLGILVGVGLVFAGMRAIVLPLFLLAPLLVGIGVWIISRSFARLLRLLIAEQDVVRHARREFRRTFDRESLPRHVFLLLLAVAEADGRQAHEERELVRRFLLERFTDPVTSADLEAWEAQRIPREHVGPLARRLAAVLSWPERETIFAWCCMVTFADRSFGGLEHAALQEIASGLELDGPRARRIFLHAKQEFLFRSERNGQPGFRSRQRTGAQGPVRSRATALQILGLDDNATPDAIRKRHRQLVKQCHPDAHAYLGPVAAQEATVRFREIQAAYELLTAQR